MKSVIILAVISLSFLFAESIHAQNTQPYTKTKDRNGNEILLGKCPVQSLKEAPYSEWFYNSWKNYTLDTATCNFIRPLLAGKKIKLFLGTWCGDSRREVPRMLKMLECCNFSENDLELVFVSNADTMYKQSPQHEEKGFNILRVPTLIIFDNGKEVGRIVEFPNLSLEKDVLAILNKRNYTPDYSEQPDTK